VWPRSKSERNLCVNKSQQHGNAERRESSSHRTSFRNYFLLLFIVLAAVIIKIACDNRGLGSKAIFCLISIGQAAADVRRRKGSRGGNDAGFSPQESRD